MKKALSLLLAAAMTASLAACGSSSSGSSESTQAQAESAESAAGEAENTTGGVKILRKRARRAMILRSAS